MVEGNLSDRDRFLETLGLEIVDRNDKSLGIVKATPAYDLAIRAAANMLKSQHDFSESHPDLHGEHLFVGWLVSESDQ